MHIVIIGNGAVGLAIASGLLAENSQLKVSIVGPFSRDNSASMAAAAMLNSFAELEPNCLDLHRDKIKFQASQVASKLWPNFLEENKVAKNFLRMGTVLINNTASDNLEDRNYDAIMGYLDAFNEPYEQINPYHIKGYKPLQKLRAQRALLIRNEGWVHPDGVLKSLEENLKLQGVQFIDDEVNSLTTLPDETEAANLNSGGKLTADLFVLANGSSASNLFNSSKHIQQKMMQITHGVGCTIELQAPTIECDYVIRTPNRGGACGIYHAPYNENSFVCGASNLITTAPEQYPRLSVMQNLTQAAMEQINTDHSKSQLLKVNVGFRPTSIDTYPVIGWLNSNTYTITGTKRDGYHFAPWIASACSKNILDATSDDEYLSFCSPFRKPYTFGTVEECADKYAASKLSALSQHGFDPGHTFPMEDLHNQYKNKVLNYFELNEIPLGIATEIIEPMMLGFIDYQIFQ